jgi:Protein tyrosine/serine phosphatase
MKKNRILLVLVLLCFGLLSLHTPAPAFWFSKSQAKETKEVVLDNFHKVSDKLYRGAKQNSEGYKKLKEMGIKTVVNLRTSNKEEKIVKKAGLNYVYIPTKTSKLGDDSIEKFLAVVSNPDNWPVFVHCYHGSDRTGAAVASYRIVFENYTPEEAHKEMTSGKYGFHSMWKNIEAYIKGLDKEKIEKWRAEFTKNLPKIKSKQNTNEDK